MSLEGKKIKDIIKFIRFENGALVLISIYVYLYLSHHLMSPNFSIIFVLLISFFSLTAGNIINDIFDIEIDKINRKDRLLASGKITLKSAKLIYIALILLSSLLSMYLDFYSILLVIFNNLLLFLYSYKLKRIAFLGNLTVAYLSASIFIFAELALQLNGPLWIVFFLTFFIHLSREILKDLEDIEGDSINNLKTFPIVFGFFKTKILILLINIVFIFYAFYTIKPFQIGDVLAYSFILLFLIPIFYQLNYLFKAKMKNDFSFISKFIKFQMLLGILFLIINKNDIT